MEPNTKGSVIQNLPQLTSSALALHFPSQTVKKQISLNPGKVLDWYISQVIKYADKDVARISLLKHSFKLMISNLPDRKYLNSIFLEEKSICMIINESDNFVDIAFTLMKHIDLQVKKVQISYGEIILKTLRSKFDQLFQTNEKNISKLLRLREIQSFLDIKAFNKDSVYDLSEFDKGIVKSEISLIYKYIFSQLFLTKTPTNLYYLMYPITNWIIALPDSTQQEQALLLDLSKKINIYLCGKKIQSNIHFINIFNILLNLLSVKYFHDDPFRFQVLAPLMLNFQDQCIPWRELINNWMQTRPNKDDLCFDFEVILRNSLNSGAIIFTFQLLDNISKLLDTLRDYNILYHLFQSFIRKDYLNIQLPNKSFLNKYLDILYFYVIGFINRDRLDGQTELDKLTDNLRMLTFHQDFVFDRYYRRILMFYKIYENRFFCLSNSSKKFVQNLQSLANINISVAQIHQQVHKYIFRQFSADYDQNDLYSLKRSQRYLGLANLGNTCYINSFMQALYMTKRFKALVIETRDSGSLPRQMVFFDTLIKLFSQLSTRKVSLQQPEVDPLFFKQKTPEPFKSSWDQHDSGEFGRLYLDSLTNQVKSIPLGESLQGMFTHKVQRKILCKKCNTSREQPESIFDFILHFNEKQTNELNVSQLLKNYFKGNELGEDNKLFCPKCQIKTQIFAKAQPEQFAEYLIATISIFRYQGATGKKLVKPLNFEFILNFKNILPNCDVDIQYQLYAFIVHLGTSSDRGHYVCYARNLQENPTIWYNFNDHYVTERQIKKIGDFKFGQNETPYILFYSTKNRQSFNTMMKQSMKLKK